MVGYACMHPSAEIVQKCNRALSGADPIFWSVALQFLPSPMCLLSLPLSFLLFLDLAFTQINLRLLLVDGKSHTFMFEPELSALDISRHVFTNWPAEWEEMVVDRPQALRLIYQGKFLNESVRLCGELSVSLFCFSVSMLGYFSEPQSLCKVNPEWFLWKKHGVVSVSCWILAGTTCWHSYSPYCPWHDFTFHGCTRQQSPRGTWLHCFQAVDLIVSRESFHRCFHSWLNVFGCKFSAPGASHQCTKT